MRKIVVAEFISLDGVVEAPETWHMPYVNDELMGVVGAAAARSDTFLLGRITYDTFAGAFANAAADDPLGQMMNAPTKVVVSRTLTELPWRNSVQLSGDVVEEVGKLKESAGGDILVTGSITLARTLLAADLVDELSLLVHPIVVGSGTRLFAENGPQIPLRLAGCTALRNGVTHHVYHRAR